MCKGGIGCAGLPRLSRMVFVCNGKGFMVGNRKVVLRLNIENRGRQSPSAPVVHTVWHFGRIFGVLGGFAALLVLIVYGYAGGDRTGAAPGSVLPAAASDGVVPPVEPSPVATALPSPAAARERVAALSVSSPQGVVYDKKVIESALNISIIDNKAGQRRNLPLKISPDRSFDLTYSNVLKNAAGQKLFHIWLKDGKTVCHKRLSIRSGREKVWSSRKFSIIDKGLWRVQLANVQGKVYSRVSFSVALE